MDARRSRLDALVTRLRSPRVVVAGDVIADEFIYGQISRVSREAPVLILNYDSTEIVPGGAGNAAANVAALGASVRIVGLTGRDEPGRRLLDVLERGRTDVRGLISPAAYRTPTKTRILAGGIHSAKQQVVRIDRASNGLVSDAVRARFRSRVLAAVRGCDALLVSDYGSGLVNPPLVDEARRHMRAAAVVLVDSRYGLLRYRRMTACTPNESEVEHALGVRIADDPRVLERAGRAVLRRTRASAVLITRGSRGMALFQPGDRTVHIPISGSDQVTDVTGAGDTVIATMTLALAAGASFEDAAHLANYAGGLVVMKRGTATVSAAEVQQAIAADPAWA